MNQKVTTLLFIVSSLVLVNTNASHKRVKRMRLLTDTDDRTEHTDAFYESIFSSENSEKLFTKDAEGILTIRDQDSSFEVLGVKYYWYGLLYSFWKGYRTCYYPAGRDPEMEKVRFPDGSRVNDIIFGCYKFQRCCGTECCFETVINAAVGLIFLIGSIYVCIYLVIKNAQEERANEVDIPLNDRNQ
ncbi:hypothetical protein L5515_008365 [Caenorhabditis briggsae]|uniref:CX domain-containing protein n=1 Tax=Caenorhabditis briggsae TaxID=6238 RepID=A0AAE9JLH6_CAEBR|nr:hypothetical protein L5515_008365 [Caenorhabditis briggsae]